MRTVYEPSSAVQAHLLKDVLRQHGMASHVQGAHLQGAIGELPAGTLVRLLVDDADYDAARRVLDDWERATPMDDDELASYDRSAAAHPNATTHATNTPAIAPLAAPKRTHPAWWAAGGAVCALALQFGLTGLPVRNETWDNNGDGVADDTILQNALGKPLTQEIDRNFDGKVDLRIEYSRTGVPVSSQADDDFNGSLETTTRYHKGNVEQTDSDTDGDGLVDMRFHSVNGVVQRGIYIHRNTGKPVRQEHYHLGKITHVQLDTNADGVLDTEQRFDTNGLMTGQSAITPSPSPSP